VGQSRLGITVTTRIGHAPARNRIKRLVREFFRRQKNRMTQSSDIVVIAKQGADRLSLAEVANELGRVLTRGAGQA
jgi:ribonuclease P protein component